jgi:2-C-methyl-D-erythritol 2,4-cyclodiphosphate synthase
METTREDAMDTTRGDARETAREDARETATLDALRTLRIGLGFDAHAFAPAQDGRALMLGGVHIPYARGLAGHSDADVLAHALADALFGAARMGDIGEHFPDSDSTWEGADSIALLGEALRLISHAGYCVLDADCVVVAQEPRLSPYREQMRTRLAEALQVPVSCVGLKATTTEHLGFEGRGEGISAQAAVLLAFTGARPGGARPGDERDTGERHTSEHCSC